MCITDNSGKIIRSMCSVLSLCCFVFCNYVRLSPLRYTSSAVKQIKACFMSAKLDKSVHFSVFISFHGLSCIAHTYFKTVKEIVLYCISMQAGFTVMMTCHHLARKKSNIRQSFLLCNNNVIFHNNSE